MEKGSKVKRKRRGGEGQITIDNHIRRENEDKQGRGCTIQATSRLMM